MLTLVSIHPTPLFIKNLPSINQTPITYTPTKIRCKINAKAKGFGSQPIPPEQKSSTIVRKSNNENDDDDKIPDVVMERMTVRILLNVGIPLATGIAFLQAFGIIKERNLWEIPRWLPFLTTLITFGASALGIAFGTLSASWDPEKKGSFLGFQEAKENWVEMWKEKDEFN